MTARVEVDFDQHSREWLAERHRHTAELRATSPVVWNSRHGGFWFVTGYDEVMAVARDNETFSTRFAEEPCEGIRYVGIQGLPRRQGLPPSGLAEVDGQRHADLRRTINPFMLPPAVARDRPFLEQLATWFLDQHIGRGTMDLVLDFANPVPAIWTMRMLGLPAERWEHFAEYFHGTASYGRDTPEYQLALSRTPEMIEEILTFVDQRRRNPGDDLLSALVLMEGEGGPLDDDELVSVLWNLIGGGVDTTTSLTSLALDHLDRDLALRDRLIGNLDLLRPACEEYLRWTSVNETLTRTCTVETELGGQTIRRGDVVMVSWLGANFDPAVFEDPADVNIDRAPNPHLAFGLGPNRCIGIHVARALFDVMMREVLSRIGDYRVDREGIQFYNGNPLLFGVVRMPASFTPAPPVGIPSPL